MAEENEKYYMDVELEPQRTLVYRVQAWNQIGHSPFTVVHVPACVAQVESDAEPNSTDKGLMQDPVIVGLAVGLFSLAVGYFGSLLGLYNSKVATVAGPTASDVGNGMGRPASFSDLDLANADKPPPSPPLPLGRFYSDAGALDPANSRSRRLSSTPPPNLGRQQFDESGEVLNEAYDDDHHLRARMGSDPNARRKRLQRFNSTAPDYARSPRGSGLEVNSMRYNLGLQCHS